MKKLFLTLSFLLLSSTAFASWTIDGVEFTCRKKLTISNTRVSADLTNFPVLVKLTSDTDLGKYCQADGDDVRFTSNDRVTLLSKELESFSISSGLATGTWWVNVPTVATASSTDIYIYFGNSTCSAQTNPEATWNSDYKAVWHFGDGSNLSLLDSTSNNIDIDTNSGVTAIAGQYTIGGARFVNTAVDQTYYLIATNGFTNTVKGDNTFTFEYWYKDNGSEGPSSPVVLGGTNWGAANCSCYAGAACPIDTNTYFGVQNIAGTYYDKMQGSQPYGTNFQHIVVMKTGTGNNKTGYYNDGSAQTWAYNRTGDMPDTTADLRFGFRCKGDLEELRISSVNRSAAWIAFEYYNMTSSNNEITKSSLVTRLLDNRWTVDSLGYAYRKRITISRNNLSGDLTDFPLKVQIINDAQIGREAKTDLTDLRFTDNSGNLLYAEREAGSITNDLANGIFWVKVPSLVTTDNNYIWCYYGNLTQTAQANPENVWDSNFKAVWHGNTLLDSTGQTTLSVEASDPLYNQINGKINARFELDGNDMYSAPDGGATDISGADQPLTLSAWVYKNETVDSRRSAIAKMTYGSSNDRQYALQTSSSSDQATYQCIRFTVSYDGANYGTGATAIGATQIANGVWQYWTGVYNDTDLRVYRNGILDSNSTKNPSSNSDGIYNGNSKFLLGGNINTNPSDFLNHYSCEIRVSNIARSADWVRFEYYNMATPEGELYWSEENPPSNTWTIDSNTYTHRKLIQVKNTYVSSDLTDFPLKVQINNDPDIGAVAQLDLDDLRFTAADGSTLLSAEKEYGQLSPYITLLHGDGQNNSTVTSDSSSYKYPTALIGNAKISTTQSKWGGSSIYCDGSADYVNVYPTAATDLGTGDFTMDCWVRFDGNGGHQAIFEYGVANNFLLQRNTDGNLYLMVNGSVIYTQAWAYSLNRWYHVAIVKQSGSIGIYIDGVKLGSSVASTYSLSAGTAGYRWGYALVGNSFGGWVEEARLVKGVSLWNSTFILPNNPYLVGASGLFWVKHPSITSASGAQMWCYYGDVDATAQANPENVWDSNFKAVWHGNKLASSSGSLSLSAGGGNETYNTSGGQVNTRLTFDGSGDYYTVNDDPSLDGFTNCTFSFWYRANSISSSLAGLLAKDRYQAPEDRSWQLLVRNTYIRFYLYASDGSNRIWDVTQTTSNDTWYYASAGYDGTNMFFSRNGGTPSTDGGLGSGKTIRNAGEKMFLASYNGTGTPGFYFNGSLDEVRISNSARSADWIKFEYYNMVTPEGELSWSMENPEFATLNNCTLNDCTIR